MYRNKAIMEDQANQGSRDARVSVDQAIDDVLDRFLGVRARRAVEIVLQTCG